LDFVYEAAAPFIPPRYKEMMQGIADGAGLTYQDVTRCVMIPEAIKAKCSMVGAWGLAVNDDSSLVQLRALDNGERGPLQNFPTLAVFHPLNPDTNHRKENVFATLNYAGFVGSFTGWSDAQVGICEKYWGSAACQCKDSRFGEPWAFVLQDVLWFAQNKEEGADILRDARRTCSIFVGLGDNATNEFNVIEYSHENVTVFTDETYPEYPDHPRMKDVLYVDKFDQPSYDPCLAELLQAQYGNITAEYMYRTVSPVLQTGSLHVAVYDYKNQYMYFSNAGYYDPEHPDQQQMGYDRPFIRVNMKTLFEDKLF